MATYVPNEVGDFVPEQPSACPVAPLESTCGLVMNHWRVRKTGPEHPLLVMTCRTHGGSFTLYPCGHVPYGRVRVAPVAEDGAVLSGSEPWRATLFDAALDARSGVVWPRELAPAHEPRRYRTQARWLERAAALLGIGSIFVEQGSWPELLGPSALAILEAGHLLEQAVGVHARGLLIGDLLDTVPLRPGVLDAVLISGATACLWGPPIRWETARGRRRFLQPPPSTGPP